MARYRVSLPARADIARILLTSDENWGSEGRRRYSALLVAALRQAAADPEGRMTRDRGELLRGLRSLHLRHVRIGDPGARVKAPCTISTIGKSGRARSKFYESCMSGWIRACT